MPIPDPDFIILVILAVVCFGLLSREMMEHNAGTGPGVGGPAPLMLDSRIRGYVFSVPLLITLAVTLLRTVSILRYYRYYSPEGSHLVFDSVIRFSSIDSFRVFLRISLTGFFSMPRLFHTWYAVPLPIFLLAVGWKQRRRLTVVLILTAFVSAVGIAWYFAEAASDERVAAILVRSATLVQLYLGSILAVYSLIFIRRAMEGKKTRIPMGLRASISRAGPVFLFFAFSWLLGEAEELFRMFAGGNDFPLKHTARFLSAASAATAFLVLPAISRGKNPGLRDLVDEIVKRLSDRELLSRIASYLFAYLAINYFTSSVQAAPTPWIVAFPVELTKSVLRILFSGFLFVDVYGYMVRTTKA